MTTHAATLESAPARVVSRDGTEIAYWTSGDGPPLLLVHGTAGVHQRFAPLLPHLEPQFTVHVMDRRGRGGSGDGAAYDLAREHEDVAAVVDAIAEASGSPVDVYGHSFGGNCAWGAALLTANVRRLVFYEGWPPVAPEKLVFEPEVEARIEALVAAGDRDAALEAFMREVAEIPAGEVAAIRAQPSWQARVATVHTVTREIRAFFANRFDPAEAARITVPTLVLTGSDTPPATKDDPETVAAALPDARLVVLEGQEHLADVLAPELFARHVVAFLREER